MEIVPRRFDLSPEIIDEIIFAMENQAEKLRFDTRAARTVPESDIPHPIDEDRYAEIPRWDSFRGFQMMERFVASLRNPIYREALREALARGKGVFRNFKNVLKEKREIEKLWFSFKDGELKREVRLWYDSLCELWGCEKLNQDLEYIQETEDLIVSDFIFETDAAPEEWIGLQQMDKTGFIEAFREFNMNWIDIRYDTRVAALPSIESEDTRLYIARSPDRELAGFIWAVRRGRHAVNIVQLYVLPEFRGFGLAKVLLQKFIEYLAEEEEHIDIEVAGYLLYISDYLQQLGFSLYSNNYTLNCRNWRMQNDNSS